MDRNTFLKYLESTKVIGHLLIAYLALLNIKSVDINFLFADGKILKNPIKITDLLRKIQKFDIDSSDKLIRYSFDLDPAIKILESPDKVQVIQLFFILALQIPIVRAFELIKFYCSETDQTEKFQNQDWYNVAWAIRNCFSHDFRLNVYGKKSEELPFTWKDITITIEMLGKPISYSDIRIDRLTDLLQAMIDSVKDYE